MGVWSSFTFVFARTEVISALPAQTRLRFSLGVMAFALAGIVFSDILEEKMPAPPPQGQPTQSNAP